MKNNNKIVKLTKLKQSSQEEIKKSIEAHFKLKDFQTYFPVMSYWEDFENNSYSKQLFILNSKYQLTSLERQSDKSKTVFLGYLKKQNNNSKNSNKSNKTFKKDLNKIEIELKDVRNNLDLDLDLDELKVKENKKIKHEIHFKINPILEPINSIMNKYKLENTTSLMPNIFDYITNKKINSPNNFSYVETLFAYLASNLVEKGKCPSFPYYYGSYLGISETFKQDITDDYHSLKKHSWFNENRDRLFELEKISVEEQLCESIPDLPKVNSLEQKNKDSSLGVEEVDFDSFEIPENTKQKRRCSATSSCSSSSSKKSNNDSDSNNIHDDINNMESFIKTLDDDEEENENDKEDKNEEEEEEDENEEGDENEWETESESNKEDGDDEEDDDDNDDDNDDEEDDDGDDDGDENSNEDGEDGEDDDDIFDEEMDDFSYNVKMKNFPVQLIAMEKLNQTLDELLKIKKITEQEWLGVLFQVCFGLSMAQKHFKFTHNDLHSSNIMFKPTKVSYLYFGVGNNTYYRIPTFGKITKIIDFARAVFTVDGHQFFSDVFKSDGDAEGQYTYPYHKGTHIKYAPNPSFDLSYLAITIREHFNHDSPIFTLLEKWTTDKYGNNLAHHTVDFDLYIKIAHNVNSAIPKNQFKNPLFNQFKIKKTDIPKNNYIYYL